MNNTPITAKELYTVKPKTVKRYAFVLAAVFPLFFFNFEFGFIDLLPDFIGYLFLVPLLSSLRDVNEKLLTVYKKIRFASIISVAKLVAIFIVFGFVAAEEGGYSSALMTFGLVFAVLDVIFVSDAMRTFFDAMDDLAQNYGCSALTKSHSLTKKNKTERMKSATTVFIIARAVCAVLPEVSTTSSHTVDDSVFQWANYTGLFRAMGAVVCLAFGLVWLVRMLVWVFSIVRDKAFIEAVSKEYAARRPALKTRFILRDALTLYGLLSVAAFFCVDVFFEQNTINCVPDALSAVLMAIAVLKGKRLLTQIKKRTALFVSACVLWAGASVAKDVIHYTFYSEFSLFAIYRNEEAYTRYGAYSLACVLSSVLFLITVLLLCSIMKHVNDQYAVSKFNLEDERAERILEEEHKETERSALLPTKIFAVISAIVSALAPFAARLSLAQTTAGTDSWSYKLTGFLVSFGSAYGFVDGLVSFVFACLLLRGVFELKQRIEGKLMLE